MTRSAVSRAEAPLDFRVGHALAGIELREALVDAGEEDEALDGVVNARIGREVAKCTRMRSLGDASAIARRVARPVLAAPPNAWPLSCR